MMRRGWAAWVRRANRSVDIRPLVMLRILLPLCVLVDLTRVGWLGLVDDLFVPFEYGGLSKMQDPHWWLADIVGPESAGPLAYGITCACMVMILTGVGVKPAIVVGVLFYAQLGHGYPPGDRGIDRIIRTALLILLFTPVGQKWSLQNWMTGRSDVDRAKGWAVDLLLWFLMIIYFSAGAGKLMQQPNWLSWTATPPLYRVMTDPLAANLSALWWSDYQGLFRFGSFGTILVEFTPFLLFTRWRPHWAVLGGAIHVGIAIAMNLGMFSFGMLSFYPMLFADWWIGSGWDDLPEQAD